MEKGPVTAHRLITADAADLFEGRRPEERTLIDACQAPFSFGLVLLIPVIVMLVAFVWVLQARPAIVQALKSPQARILHVLDR